ncbi:ABC transporter permease [Butyricicoccus faecihominis]|uniref:ABC transporter permease n=1 Tax=Butyricicoccus faecihominis TaxID=1712515 RepID=UPI00247A35C2|nr:ABC transporter permease [Butyricicoccus faecihominis]MCQ5128369.1 ABC transporter permease [Butyricicoccus faecihominis]
MKKKQFASAHDFLIWVVLLGLMLMFSLLSPAFFKVENLLNIGKQVAVYGIMAVGMTFVILTGGIDISVGSLLGLVSVLAANFIVKVGMPPLFAVLIAVLIGTISGVFAGIFVVKLQMPPMVGTLALMTIDRGIAYIISNGLPIYGLPDSFRVWGQGYIGIVPVPLIIMSVIFVIGGFVLNKTRYGRYIYAAGGNEEATRLAGVNTDWIKMSTYIVSGFLASIAAVVMLSRMNSGQPTTGMQGEMDVITAVFLGGVSVTGGEGKLSGVLAGAFIMGVLSNGMIILGISEFYQMVIKGVVLVVAVAIDKLGKRRRTGVRAVKS